VTRSLSYDASAGPSTYEKSELHDVDSCGGKKGREKYSGGWHKSTRSGKQEKQKKGNV
jgi:hypothetical protein